MRDELSRFILPASWLCRKTENLFVRVHGLCILSTPSAFPNPCSLMGTHCQPPHMTPSCNHTSNLYSIWLHMLAWEKVIMKGKKGLILVKLCLAVFGIILSNYVCLVLKWYTLVSIVQWWNDAPKWLWEDLPCWGFSWTPHSLPHLWALPSKDVPFSSSSTQGLAPLPLAPDLGFILTPTTSFTVWSSATHFTCA